MSHKITSTIAQLRASKVFLLYFSTEHDFDGHSAHFYVKKMPVAINVALNFFKKFLCTEVDCIAIEFAQFFIRLVTRSSIGRNIYIFLDVFLMEAIDSDQVM